MYQVVVVYTESHVTLCLSEAECALVHRVLTVLGHIAKNIDKSALLQLAGGSLPFFDTCPFVSFKCLLQMILLMVMVSDL